MSTKDKVPSRPHRRQTKEGLRFCVYFPILLENKVREFIAVNNTERVRLTRSALVQRAVARYIKEDDTYWGLIFKRINDLTANIKATNLRIDILCNLFMHYLAYFFLNWPDHEPEEKRDAVAKALSMIALFQDSLNERLKDGGYIYQLTPEHIKEMILESAKELNLDEIQAKAQQHAQKEHHKRTTQTHDSS